MSLNQKIKPFFEEGEFLFEKNSGEIIIRKELKGNYYSKRITAKSFKIFHISKSRILATKLFS